jgi:anti-anti-sigma factor
MTTPLTPEVSRQDDVTVIALSPGFERLDTGTIYRIEESFLNAIKSADPPLVLVDLTHTKFFSSAFITLLVQMHRRVQARNGGRLAVTGLSNYCREVLRTTQVHKLLEIYSTRDEAVRVLRNV